jgi:hypothetical protein
MDRTACITALMAAGMTWSAATALFHDQIAWRPERDRTALVEHYVVLAQEDQHFRREE